MKTKRTFENFVKAVANESKHYKERQNIVKTYSDALRTFTGQEKTSMKESEDYFNQTFKQEQK